MRSLTAHPYAPVAANMMAQMGYRPGNGLGAREDGIRLPIEARARPRQAGLDCHRTSVPS
jgi:hypothetical protein